MRNSCFALLAVLVLAAATPRSGVAQVASAAAVKWTAGPDFLPKGARMAVLQGDPSKSGVYTLRLRLPANYRIAAHYHPTDEHVTVLSGTFVVGMGDSVNMKQSQRLTAGGFITAPANAHHWARTRTATVLQIHGEGPFQITYVKDSDDPRNKH
jgi:quercetin dioxygenase-like cupin family protein